MRTSTLTAIMIASLATAGFSAEKPRKPRLDLRAAPRMAFSPVNVLLTAELQGGDDVDAVLLPGDRVELGRRRQERARVGLRPPRGGRHVRAPLHRAARVPPGRHLQRQGHHAEGQPPLAVATATVTVRAGRRRLLRPELSRGRLEPPGRARRSGRRARARPPPPGAAPAARSRAGRRPAAPPPAARHRRRREWAAASPLSPSGATRPGAPRVRCRGRRAGSP